MKSTGVYIQERDDGAEGMSRSYTVSRHAGGWRRLFPPETQRRLRPIAEVLAMIDSQDCYNWKDHLPEADAIYRSQDHLLTSWRVFEEIAEYDSTVKDAVNNLKTVMKLKGYGDV